MHTLSTPRLHLLRATYLLMAVGLGFSVWPSIIAPAVAAADAKTVVRALLGTIGAMALLGLRHPVRMLPLLLFELLWKAIWLVAFALPLWRAGTLDATASQNAVECLVGVALMAAVLPWGHVGRQLVLGRADAG